MKKFASLVLVSSVVLSLAFAGCTSQDQPETTTTPDQTHTEGTTLPAESQKPTAPAESSTPQTQPTEQQESQISQNWEDLEFILRGDVCSLPRTVREYEAYGWKLRDEGMKTERPIGAGAYTTPIFKLDSTRPDADNLSLTVAVSNKTEEDLPVEDCMIRILVISLLPKEDTKEEPLILAKNIRFGMGEQEVLDAYGTPDKRVALDHEKDKELGYKAENGASMQLVFDKETDKLHEVWLIMKR